MTKADCIRAAVKRRGLTLERWGRAWWIRGPGIDVLAAEIAFFEPSDLNPHAHQPRQTERTGP